MHIHLFTVRWEVSSIHIANESAVLRAEQVAIKKSNIHLRKRKEIIIKKSVFFIGPQEYSEAEKGDFLLSLPAKSPHAIPLPSYGLCSCWHSQHGDVHMPLEKPESCSNWQAVECKGSSPVRGPLLCAAQLISGLPLEGMRTNMCGMDKSLLVSVPLCSALKAL